MEELVVLKGPDRVRKRPQVIFSSDSVDGACAAVNEILKNSTEEARQGFGKKIFLHRYKDLSIEISDFGRGIPVDYNNDENEFDWKINFCQMYAQSRNFFEENGNLFSLGVYGCGLYATQCASEYMDAEIIRNEYKYSLHFEKGYNIDGLKKEKIESAETGTKIHFKLDDAVFSDINVPCEMLEKLMRDYAITNKGISFELQYDDEYNYEQSFLYDTLSDRITEHYSKKVKTYNKYLTFDGEESGRKNSGTIDISIAFNEDENLKESFCNGRFLLHGGIAIWSLEEIIKNEIIKRFPDVPNKDTLVDDIINQVSIVVNVEMRQHKEKWQSGFRAAITNPLVEETIKNNCQTMIGELIEDNIETIKDILKRV